MRNRLALLLLLLLLPSVASAQTFPDDWAGYVEINPTEATLTDFSYVVSLNSFPADFWTNVQTDGDDIRATDELGNQLAVDIIKFTDSGSSGSGLITVRYTGAVDTDLRLRIYAGEGTATLPADTDTYGRENAYESTVRAFWPDGLGIDRTSYDNDLTAVGSPTVGGQAGPIAGSLSTDLDGSTQYASTTVSVPTAAPLTFLASARSDSSTANQGAISLTDTAGTADFFLFAVQGGTAGDPIRLTTRRSSTVFADTATGYSTATWTTIAATEATGGASRIAFIEGTGGTAETTSKIPTGVDTITVGAFLTTTASQFMDGRLSLVSLHTTQRSADWLDYDAAMKADQSIFYGTPTWTASAANAVPIIIHNDQIHRR